MRLIERHTGLGKEDGWWWRNFSIERRSGNWTCVSLFQAAPLEHHTDRWTCRHRHCGNCTTQTHHKTMGKVLICTSCEEREVRLCQCWVSWGTASWLGLCLQPEQSSGHTSHLLKFQMRDRGKGGPQVSSRIDQIAGGRGRVSGRSQNEWGSSGNTNSTSSLVQVGLAQASNSSQ